MQNLWQTLSLSVGTASYRTAVEKQHVTPTIPSLTEHSTIFHNIAVNFQ